MKFQRIQFTPDLLPADVVGTVIYNQRPRRVRVQAGARSSRTSCSPTRSTARPPRCSPRCSRRCRSARSRSATRPTRCPIRSSCMATQNPIEQEGTYPLPEAQVDRFMLMIKVGYPTREEERAIMDRMTAPMKVSAEKVATPERDRRGARRRAARSTSTRRSGTTSSASCSRRASRRRTASPSWPTSSSSAPARARRSRSTWRRARTRSCATAATSRPRTSRRSASTCCATASILTYEAEAEEVTAETVVRKLFERVEVP